MITDKYLHPVKMGRIREGRGLSRAEVARRAGLNAADVGRMESGRLVPYDGQLVKIARALGVEDPEALMEPAEA